MLGRVLLTSFGAAALATSVFAAPDMDPICPPASSIIAAGISEATETLPNMYVASHEDTYGMDRNWGFALGPVDAASSSEALDKSHKFLQTLHGPITSEEVEGLIICLYDTANPDVVAFAVSAEVLPGKQAIRQVIKNSNH